MGVSDLTRGYETSEIKKLNQSNAGKKILSKIVGDKKHYDRRKDKISRIRSEKIRKVSSDTDHRHRRQQNIISTR